MIMKEWMGDFGMITVIISVPSSHSNGQYELKFENYEDMRKIPFVEKDEMVGMSFGGIFYPINSISYEDNIRLDKVKKNKLNDKLKEFDKLGETDNYYIIKKDVY